MERAVFAVGGIAAEALHGKNTVADDKAHAGNCKQQCAEAEIENGRTHGGAAHEADEGTVGCKGYKQFAHVESVLFGALHFKDKRNDKQGNGGDPCLGCDAVKSD